MTLSSNKHKLIQFQKKGANYKLIKRVKVSPKLRLEVKKIKNCKIERFNFQKKGLKY